jgi:hypothetical protein
MNMFLLWCRFRNLKYTLVCRVVQKRIGAQNIYVFIRIKYVFIRIQYVFIRIYTYLYVFNTAYLYWARYVSNNPTSMSPPCLLLQVRNLSLCPPHCPHPRQRIAPVTAPHCAPALTKYFFVKFVASWDKLG